MTSGKCVLAPLLLLVVLVYAGNFSFINKTRGITFLPFVPLPRETRYYSRYSSKSFSKPACQNNVLLQQLGDLSKGCWQLRGGRCSRRLVHPRHLLVHRCEQRDLGGARLGSGFGRRQGQFFGLQRS